MELKEEKWGLYEEKEVRRFTVTDTRRYKRREEKRREEKERKEMK